MLKYIGMHLYRVRRQKDLWEKCRVARPRM